MIKLAIIGASYLQVPLVRKAKEMGIETHCFAWKKGSVCKDISDFYYPLSVREKEKILQVCRRIAIDGVTSIASDLAIPTVCYVAGKLGLIANDYNDVLAATNKYHMRNRFVEYSVKSPRFAFAGDNYSIEDLRFPLIVKPTDRSGSRGVMKISRRKELHRALERAKRESFTHNAIIEEFVSGREVSVESVSWRGRHYILAITDKVTTEEPFFVELEHHQPSTLPTHIQLKLKKETIKALNAINVKYGASHTELKVTSSGDVYVIELGARMGGDFIGSDLVRLSTGYDFLKGIINIALGHFREPKINKRKCAGIFYLSKETKKRIFPVIQNAASNKDIVSAEIIDEKLHSVQSSADRSGYFIYQSKKRYLI
jgi:biotin carboxylase